MEWVNSGGKSTAVHTDAAKKYTCLRRNEPLYDPNLLKLLDFTKFAGNLNPPISAIQPGNSLIVRPLRADDYERGFLELLNQLTKVGYVSQEQFLNRFAAMKACEDSYYVTVVEDTQINKIVGAATLVVEKKFIHNCSLRGHLEDVVVNKNCRGKQLGKLIVITVALLAEQLNCYKITLDCKDELVPFYKSIGYTMEPGNSNSMTIRFDQSSEFQKRSMIAKL